MTDLLRWGILGTGRMARAFARDLKLLPDARLMAVGSRRPDSARHFGDEFQVPLRFGSYDELAASDQVDAIYVASPPSLHCEHALLCMQSGKHVLCEKPFALSAAQARRMIRASEAHGVFLMEAMWTRFIPAVVQLRRLLAEQKIGAVQLLLAGGGFIPEPDPDFYLFRRDLGGGVLLDAGVYLVSMASMVLGPPDRIAALGGLAGSGIDDHEGVLLSHATGPLAVLHVSLRTRAAPDLTLLGSKGRIHVAAPIFCPRRLTVTESGAEEDLLEFPFEGSGYRFQTAEVAHCIRDGRRESAIMSQAETLQIMTTLDRIRGQLGVSYPGE
jgi:predicted dehydrogenase